MTQFIVLPIILLVTLGHAPAVGRQAPGIDKIPKKVMDALNARFPGAIIETWTVEKEANRELYDIEFRQKGRKMEADIYGDGSLHNWEREIAVKDVPLAVTKAVGGRYPKATPVVAMVVTAIASGKEALEGYEIVLKTGDGGEVELTVAPDGTILEDAGTAAATPAAAERPGELNLTVTYKGKGDVDDTHDIFVWLFDNPNIGAGSKPIAVGVLKKNGGVVQFTELAVTPVYVAVAYDEKGDYDGTQGPPPPGTPVAIYSTDGQGTPAPIDVKGTANVAMTFDDSQRMGG
jgi:hypothetical protein